MGGEERSKISKIKISFCEQENKKHSPPPSFAFCCCFWEGWNAKIEIRLEIEKG